MKPRAVGKRPRILASPLRYPGGKGSMYYFLVRLLTKNGLGGSTYVEPFAGGAGAGMGLLVTGYVDRVVINDLDPCVHAFWKSLVNDPDSMEKRIREARLNVVEWRKQKEIFMHADPRSDLGAVGFATFYLNRTNRSGVLNGGPIGGLDQLGNYKIDARFNKTALAERVRTIGLYSSKISVTKQDGNTVIRRYAKNLDAFIYADPPYFEKAGSLYMNSFKAPDHERLANTLVAAADQKWILTYDNVPTVQTLYAGLRMAEFELNYSAHRVTTATEVMVYSNGLREQVPFIE